MFPKRYQITLLILGAGLFIGLGYAIFRPATKPPPLPNPNGYDDFLVAATLVAEKLPDFGILEGEELKQSVKTNHAALQKLREGLGKKCQAPPIDDLASLNSRVERLGELKLLARLLFAEGKEAETEGRLTNAIQSYLDTIRYGQEVGRGGLMIENLIGMSCEELGFERLHQLEPSFDTAEARAVIAALEDLDRRRESWKFTLENENKFDRHVGGLFFRIFVNPIVSSQNKASDDYVIQVKVSRARFDLFMAEVAIRSFRAEHDAYPSQLADLVPQFLHAVPRDPFSTNELIYRPLTNDFRLYSVGPDGKDDGGRPRSTGSQTWDIPSSTLGFGRQ